MRLGGRLERRRRVRRSSTSGAEERPVRARLVLVRHADAAGVHVADAVDRRGRSGSACGPPTTTGRSQRRPGSPRSRSSGVTSVTISSSLRGVPWQTSTSPTVAVERQRGEPRELVRVELGRAPASGLEDRRRPRARAPAASSTPRSPFPRTSTSRSAERAEARERLARERSRHRVAAAERRRRRPSRRAPRARPRAREGSRGRRRWQRPAPPPMIADSDLPRRALVVGLARSGGRPRSRSPARGVAVARDRPRRGARRGEASRSGRRSATRRGRPRAARRRGPAREKPRSPGGGAPRRGRARAWRARLERGRARRAAPPATRSSASPARTGRRRRPSSSARSSAPPAGRSRSPATSAARSARSTDARLRTRPGSSASSRASSSRTSSASAPRRRPPQPHARPPRPPRRRSRLPRRQAAPLREPGRRTTPRSSRAGSAPVPGAAAPRRVRGGRPLPAEPLIPGAHNRENAAAAAAAARAAGIPDDAIAEALRTFPGVPHRLEPVGEVGGVRFVNDSKATNPEAAERALTAYDARFALILGGSRKGASFDRAGAARLASTACRRAYLIGESADEIAAALGRADVPFARVGDLETAVARRGRRRRAGRGRPALARVRELRPVPRLRGPRRTLPRARGGAVRAAARRRTTRVPPARPRHARPRRVRARDGLQRELGRAAVADGDPAYYLKRQALYAVARASSRWSCSRASTSARCAASAGRCSRQLRAARRRARRSGRRVNGARRWLPLGVIDFQPSELAKLALALWLAAFLARRRGARSRSASSRARSASSCWAACALDPRSSPTSAPSIAIVAHGGAMLVVAGTPLRVARRRAGDRSSALALAAIWLEPYRRDAAASRSWIRGPTREGAGFQTVQAHDRARLGRPLRRRPRGERPEDQLPARGARRT